MFKYKLISKVKGGYVVRDLKQGIEHQMSTDWVKDAIQKGYISNGVINKETNQVNKVKEVSGENKKSNIVQLSDLKKKSKKVVEEKDFKTPNDLNFVKLWTVRLVRQGGKYSDGDLVHKNEKPLVEFVNKEKGKAVADYYIDSILDSQGGFNLGRSPQNMIFPLHMNEIRDWLRSVL